MKLIENSQTKILSHIKILPSRADCLNKLHWRDYAIVIPLFWSWVFLVIGILFSILSILIDYIGAMDLSLFQRSGAILVATGTYLQFRMPDYHAWDHEMILKASTDTTPEYDRFLRVSKIFYRMAWTSIILGTLIWAYGDFLIM